MAQALQPTVNAGDKYVFVSYSHSDWAEVEPILARLDEWGVKAWFDDHIHPGENWQEEIADAIGSAHLVLILVSPNSSESTHCKRELHYALSRDSHLLAIHLHATDSSGVDFALGDRQSILKYELSEERFEDKFAAAVRDLMTSDKPRIHKHSSVLRRKKFALLLILGALVIVFAPIIFQGLQTPVPGTEIVTQHFNPAPNSVAVLPFTNISEEEGNDYFSDGMTEEILNALANIRKLSVTARTSAFILKDRVADIMEIGRRLNVSKVLQGSIRKSGNQLRISVQLVDTRDGFHVWSRSYDRDLKEIFQIQKEISTSVAEMMEVTMGQEEEDRMDQVATANVEAYDLYLLGRHHFNERSITSIMQGISFFEQALEISPDFVLPLSGLADSYFLLQTYGDLSAAEAAKKMTEPIEKALRLDENNAIVHTSQGAMHRILGHFGLAEAAFKKAIELNHNYATAHMWLGNLLVNQNRLQEARNSYTKALRLDPLNVAVMLNNARLEMFQGHPDSGFELFERAQGVHPKNALVFDQKAYWLKKYGHQTEALDSAMESLRLDSKGTANLGTLLDVYLNMGAFPESRLILDQAIERAPNSRPTLWAKSEYHFLRGEFAEMDSFLQTKLNAKEQSSDIEHKMLYLWAAVAKLHNADFPAAAAYFDTALAENFPYQFEAPFELMFRGLRVLAHRQAGNAATARRAIEEVNEFVAFTQAQSWSQPDYLARVAAIYAIEGREAEALELLDKAVAEGYSKYLELRQDLSFASLRGHPDFQRLVDSIEQEMKGIRSTIREGGDIDPRLVSIF